MEEIFTNVFIDGDKLYTKNLIRGERVYGEKLIDFKGKELREWNPRRSKLAAAIMKGYKNLPFKKELFLFSLFFQRPRYVNLFICIRVVP